MNFTEDDKLKALAIVHVFETGKPLGDYAACVVLNDGAGVSYGINQFTHRSGSLAQVVEAYLKTGASAGREVLAAALPILESSTTRNIARLSASVAFKHALRAAAATPEMKAAQNKIAFERYLLPALRECERRGFTQALSLAVVYDSITHGSWERLSAVISKADERQWITSYVRRRHLWLTSIRRLRVTNYRTRFFLNQIMIGNWTLKLPLNVHGVALREIGTHAASVPDVGSSAARALLSSFGETAGAAVDKFDTVDRVVTGFATRRDSVKSMWTTVLGTAWQALWAVFGFFIGLPRSVWIVVAVIAGILIAMYLYRQIALGKMREAKV